MSEGLAREIERLWEAPAEEAARGAAAVEEVIGLLDEGAVRVAEKRADGWVVNEWVKKAILLYFRIRRVEPAVPGRGLRERLDRRLVEFGRAHRRVLRAASSPGTWPRWPSALLALLAAVDTDVPIWQWPRLGFALLRAGPGGIDDRVIGREMVSGFTTAAGAQVLAPDWSRINPVLLEMFGQ